MLRLAFALLLAGCHPSAPVGAQVAVPPDSAAQCTKACGAIGLLLDSVVIMANNVGCVCRAQTTPQPGTPAAGAAAGMTTIMIQQWAAAAAVSHPK